MPEPTFPPEDHDYSTFSCPNPHCPRRGQRRTGNIVHRSWTGTDKHIERLRCTQCGQEFSSRRGTLMEATKLPEATVERLLKCQRWGVCDAGTADICGVDIKTVHRFQHVAARRAQEHHEQVTQELRGEGVQLDEMHSKLRRRRVEWLHTALAMGSLFLLWVYWGPRTQESAALLIAQVVARLCGLPVWLSDGWKAYPAALLQVLGRVYRRHRRGRRGPHPKPRLGPPRDLFYGQVVKVRDRRGKLLQSFPAWSTAVPGASSRRWPRGGCGPRSRPPSWSAGMAPCAGCVPRCAGAPAVALRVRAGTLRGSGWWSTSTILCCRIRACGSRAGRVPPRWPSDWRNTYGVIGTISGIPCIRILSAAS